MSFVSNNMEYSIVTNTEVSEVIAHFSDEMILDILEKNLQNRLSFIPKVNIVESLEVDFKRCFDLYPAYSDQIQEKRFHVYGIIIDTICRYNHIECSTTNDASQIYTQAYFLYDLLISKFTDNVITFFTNYIIREKSSLYELMDEEVLARNKDFNTIYSKKVFKNNNPKIIALHANLEYVIDNICAFDINFETYVQNIYSNQHISNYLSLVTAENSGELFHTQIVPFIMANKPIIITYVKLSLQSYIEFGPDEIIKE